MSFILFLLLGIFAGALGSLIGAGGGFIVVPLMLMLYPNMRAEEITAISLCVVFFNGVSGSIAYAKMKQIEYKIAFVIILSAIPSAIAGSHAVKLLPLKTFGLIFGVFLVGLSLYMLLSPKNKQSLDGEGKPLSTKVGVGIGLLSGLVSGLLGIGGGTIQVPLMVNIMKVDIKRAAATSVFVLAFVSLISNLSNITSGVLLLQMGIIIPISIGAIIGAKIGAFLSKKLSGGIVTKLLTITMIIVGLRLILRFFAS